MFKPFPLFVVAIFMFLLTVPAYCSTMSFYVSATIPEHIVMNKNLGGVGLSNNYNQLVQTDTVIRNNQAISVTSIVVL